ncbi:MAG: hypothetical protein LBQ88_08135 [Treponema sp.]|jgi:hypothetical protein|nr:hypothetical protein [Treponema sp.]
MISQYLVRRIDMRGRLSAELEAWRLNRNTTEKSVNRQFTTQDTQIKFHGLFISSYLT